MHLSCPDCFQPPPVSHNCCINNSAYTVYTQNKYISGKEKKISIRVWRSKGSFGCVKQPLHFVQKKTKKTSSFFHVCTRILWPYVDFSVVILFLSFPVCRFCQLHSEDDEVATFGVSVNQAAGITELEALKVSKRTARQRSYQTGVAVLRDGMSSMIISASASHWSPRHRGRTTLVF